MTNLVRAIRTGEKLVNPLAPDAAALIAGAYDFWDTSEWAINPESQPDSTVEITQRWPPWDGPANPWQYRAVEWENVQMLVCWRDLLPDEGGSGKGERLVCGVVPGTNEGRDWTAGNLNPWPLRIGGLPGRWRRGFSLPGSWIWSQVRQHVRPGDKCALVGHSYGAAAVIAASAFAIRDGYAHRMLGVLAFAAPRVTSADAAELLNSHYGGGIGQRYILGFDIVPWSVIPLGWHHAMEPVFVGADGVARRAYRFWDEALAAFKQDGLQAISDHGMGRYLEWARSLPDPEKV